MNLWRILRNDADSGIRMSSTIFAAAVFKVTGVVVPSLNEQQLRTLIAGCDCPETALKYMIDKCEGCLAIIDRAGILSRHLEIAATCGMDLQSTFSRGSQYRVECVLFRVAAKMNAILLSPSKSDVKDQRAMEGIPLVLEPVSGLHRDPVAVCDFRSLYPSIIVAHNICFSTCLGLVSDENSVRLGVKRNFSRNLVAVSRDSVVLPGGCAFVKSSKRPGILPRILLELVETRKMLKAQMKRCSPSENLFRQLDMRQQAIKLLANVVYGYTAASFSGRMPCAEVADAVVLTGRAVLEHAMTFCKSAEGRLVYGDTDSVFVKFTGSTIVEAFGQMQSFLSSVNSTIPWPVELACDKIYESCVLVTKKRYVGYSFQSVDTDEPVVDAKGIETIRRDNCPLTQKVVDSVLKAVFTNRLTDPLQVIEYVFLKHIDRINRGVYDLSDYVFQNEVRDLSSYASETTMSLAATSCVRRQYTPLSGERIPFIILLASGGDRNGNLLREKVCHPSEAVALLSPSEAHPLAGAIDIEYYVTKQIIPALSRLFGLELSIYLKALFDKNQLRVEKDLRADKRTISGVVKGQESQSNIGKQSVSIGKQGVDLLSLVNESNSQRSNSVVRSVCLSCSGHSTVSRQCTDAYHCPIYFKKLAAWMI